MAAKIIGSEVAFAFGEHVTVSPGAECKIEPTLDGSGQVTEKGVIVIRIPYADATIEKSIKPKERLFSICNPAENANTIFTHIDTWELSFSTNTRAVVDPENAPKVLTLVISGSGPKKNSSS